MTRQISAFTPVHGLEGVYIARAGRLHCFALRLRNGGLCLYSPLGGLAADTRDQLESLGGVTVLLAPNHYHNKGLQEHVDAFPDALLVCTTAAEPRLRKVTGLSFAPLGMLGTHLMDGHDFFEPEGVKTGEVWVQIEGAQTAWIVTDAFSAELHPLGEYATAPNLLKTFPKYGVSDATRFRHSTLRLLEESTPTLLLCCHGSPVKAKNLHVQLSDLVADSF
ncbi:MAG: hypothetical protein WC889_01330 [Myxococcota bacterium]|jgi:hypothetical protein